MEDLKNSTIFNEYMFKARQINNEYNEKIKIIRIKKNIKGRGNFPEEKLLKKERDDKIQKLAYEYNVKI